MKIQIDDIVRDATPEEQKQIEKIQQESTSTEKDDSE